MQFNADEIEALRSNTQNRAVLMRLATVPKPIAVWLGAGPLKIPVGQSLYDPAGQIYQGMGQLPNLPAFKAMLNGKAERIDISISGVNDDVLAAAMASQGQVQNKECVIGIAFYSPKDWTMLGPVKWMRWGICDQMSVARVFAKTPGDVTTQVISISVGSLTTGLRRGRYAFWTDQDQQARFPGDRGCERTVQMSRIAQKTWPT